VPILTPEERVGTVLAAKYRLDRIIATGGMATVFAGLHAWTERAVAVKILNYEHARDPEVVRRFLQEARAAAQLKHPNVVDVLDMGQDQDGTVFLILELLEGETLKAYLKRGALGVPEVSSLLVPILRALSAAHAKGVVHRDIKPDNIFLATGPSGEIVPKLLDFGIAKVASGDSTSTRTGTMVGTPQYMSPEQVRGEREVGTAADVWSMGVLLHYGLSKKMPFNAESAAAVLARVLTERARPLREVAPEVPDALAVVVDRALQHDPAHRYADMGQMLAALEAGLAGALLAPRPVAETATAAIQLPVAPTSSSLPSEYPPAPTTPFAWGAPAVAVEPATPARDAKPFLAAGAALVLLLGATTFWLVLGPLNNDAAPAARVHSLGPVAAPAAVSTPVPASPPAPVLPANTVAVPATVAAPTTAIAPPPVNAPAVAPAGVETTVSPAAPAPTAVPELVAPTPEPSPRAPEDEVSRPERSTAERSSPDRTRRGRGTSAATEEDDTTEEPAARASRGPQRGTGGALILDDRGTSGAERSGAREPRRGTGGALILH